MSWSISAKGTRQGFARLVKSHSLYDGASTEERETFEAMKNALLGLAVKTATSGHSLCLIEGSACGHGTAVSGFHFSVSYVAADDGVGPEGA